jgi:hypothetical protein
MGMTPNQAHSSLSPVPPQKHRSPNRVGCILLLVVVLIVLGAAAYAATVLWNVHLPGIGGQPQITTQNLGQTVPYAGVDVTLLNAQQSQSFADDPHTANDGMIRLNVQEKNSTQSKISWSYFDVAQLLLPDKTRVKPAYVKSLVSLAPGVSATNVIDFAVPSSDSISQLTLLLGRDSEAQMNIPLSGKADANQYQPKTTQLQGQALYYGLNWTLKSATASYSIAGQQASSGNRYVTLLFSVDNTLSQEAIVGSPYSYMRLHYGNTSIVPASTTLPVSFETGANNVTGTVSFLVPQNATAFTLILLQQNGFDQASINFHV